MQRRIEGEGTAEAVWREWLDAAAIPERPVLQLLRPDARLVVVAPHPDDELLACGGLMAAHAAQAQRAGLEADLLVIAVSDGEASHAGGTSPWTPPQLAAVRRAEREEGLKRLGLRARVAGLGLPDGRVCDQTVELAGILVEWLRPADAVVTPWRLDGHPDHDATGVATATACLAVGCRLLEAPVWMWHWAEPGDPRVPWQRLVGVPLAAHIVASKQRALAAHTSQLLPREGGQGPVLGAAILQRAARPTEYFFA
jgi:LmbE family N-acetylglucosaminyl deacetylase